jgi:hypothetical protein
VDFALESGTLLGAIRENAILKHEFDTDVLILPDELPKIMTLRQLFYDKYGCVQTTLLFSLHFFIFNDLVHPVPSFP